MKFYEFNQNNSGGKFHSDEILSHYVFIEAPNAVLANHIAETIGIYFDGCSIGRDCNCCGDRWHKVNESNALEVPLKYSKERLFNSVEEYASYLSLDDMFFPNGSNVRIHYKDGTIKEF